MASQNEHYAFAIGEVITSLFDQDSDNHRYNLDEIDATEFFVGLVKAGALVFNKLTGDDKNFLEYTHLCNQLIVQDMLEKKGAA